MPLSTTVVGNNIPPAVYKTIYKILQYTLACGIILLTKIRSASGINDLVILFYSNRLKIFKNMQYHLLMMRKWRMKTSRRNYETTIFLVK